MRGCKMRVVWMLFFALPIALLAAGKNLEDIDKDINANKQKLQEKAKEEQKISSRLSTLGNTINNRKKQINSLKEQINFLQRSINQNQSQSQSQEKRLENLRKQLKSLEEEKSAIQAYIANIIISDIAFTLVLDKQSVVSPDDVILEDVFGILTKQSQKKILALSEKQNKTAEQIGLITNNINEITVLIGTQQNKKDQLQKMIIEQNSLNEKLQAELNDYNQKLLQISKEREGLDTILQDLNIIKANKQKEIEQQKQALIAAQKAQKEKEERERLAAANAAKQGEQTKDAGKDSSKDASQSSSQSPSSEAANIVQVANSYKNVAVVKYTGAKTIAPLDYYTIEQNFGPYYDPVYNLKVFNESVTLISKTPNAVVYNIFDGKVVYAKEAPILKKVVIVEHSNEMYSIYSQLDKIAPTVKPGFIVKKGYTIGRVSQRLGLEITQKDKHIDPLEVISKSK
ncbi:MULTISPECIES: murein hydrolase activator EnvC family protein [unclassified Helicobacter]|uniref:murein hydrolase activator EnvC family protein n=1 Tax=unclassified Helicobacter TaxID=2593540 RepID=UPI000AFD8664|nr:MULTISPECIES: peptidoglycan DD-metalloendopeptidase family protein [unclassified Helicobacter]